MSGDRRRRSNGALRRRLRAACVVLIAMVLMVANLPARSQSLARAAIGIDLFALTSGPLLIGLALSSRIEPATPDFEEVVRLLRLYLKHHFVAGEKTLTVAIVNYARREPDRRCTLQAIIEAVGLKKIVVSDEGAPVPFNDQIYILHYTKGGEVFYHYSDRKWDQRGGFSQGLREGSFATTDGSLTSVEATERLALRSYGQDGVYEVRPKICTPIAWDNPKAARPKNGQPGGVDEYLFPSGTGPNTVKLHHLIEPP